MPELPPAEIARLVALYHRDRARWKVAPKAAQTRTRLARVHRLALEASEAFAELHSIDCQLAGIDEATTRNLAHELLTKGSAAGAMAQELDQRGAGNGGARHVLHVVEPSPRAKALLEILALYRTQGIELTKDELADAAVEVFTEAGDDEPTHGLDKVIRGLSKFQN